jgi:hypothetical protein
MPSEDGQLTETCQCNKYLQIESHWAVLKIRRRWVDNIKMDLRERIGWIWLRMGINGGLL